MTSRRRWAQFWGTAWRVNLDYDQVEMTVVADHVVDSSVPAVKFSFPLPPVQLGDSKGVGKRIKKELAAHKISTRRVVLVVSGTPLAVHVVRFPGGHGARISTDLKAQMGRYVLFSGGTPIVTHKVLQKAATASDETVVFAAGIRSDVVLQWQEICKWIGVTLDAVTSPILLAIDAAEHHPVAASHSWGVLVAQDHGMLWVGAIYKHSLRAILPISVAAATDLNALSAHIHRLTQGCQTEAPPFFAIDHSVTNGRVVESAADQLSGIKIHLAKQSVPVFTTDRLNGLGWRAGLEKSEISKKTAIFLACYAWIASLITLTMFFGFFLGGVMINREISDVQKELHMIQSQFKEAMELDVEIREMKQLISDRRKTGASKDASKVQTQFFSGLPTVMSAGTSLTIIEIGNDGTVDIHGKASRSDDVFMLLKQLKALSSKEGMELKEVVQDPTTGLVAFRIQGRLKNDAQ